MRVAVLSSIAWRTPPRQYGPWEQVASYLTEGLVERILGGTGGAKLQAVAAAEVAA